MTSEQLQRGVKIKNSIELIEEDLVTLREEGYICIGKYDEKGLVRIDVFLKDEKINAQILKLTIESKEKELAELKKEFEEI